MSRCSRDMQPLQPRAPSIRRESAAVACQLLPACQQLLDAAQQKVGSQRHQRGRDRAGENHAVVDHGDAAKDELAQSARADSRSDGRHADRDHGGDANSREDDRQRPAAIRPCQSNWLEVSPMATAASRTGALMPAIPT